MKRPPAIVARAEWHAKPPKEPIGVIPIRVREIFVHTTVTAQLPAFSSKARECEAVRDVQAIAFGRGFDDISYSFLVAPSGRIYEGRGRRKIQAATLGHNDTSYSIATLGNTDAFKPTRRQRRSIRRLIDYLQLAGDVATSGVDVRGHREVAAKACPGKNFTDGMIATIQRKVNA